MRWTGWRAFCGIGNRILAGIRRYLRILQNDGEIFLTPTVYNGAAAMRISITNWRTTERELELAWQALLRAAAKMIEG